MPNENFEILGKDTTCIVLLGTPDNAVSRKEYIEKYCKGYVCFAGWCNDARNAVLKDCRVLVIITDNKEGAEVRRLTDMFRGSLSRVFEYYEIEHKTLKGGELYD